MSYTTTQLSALPIYLPPTFCRLISTPNGPFERWGQLERQSSPGKKNRQDYHQFPAGIVKTSASHLAQYQVLTYGGNTQPTTRETKLDVYTQPVD